jgi:hypothetical protein
MPTLWCSQGLWLPSFAGTVGDGSVTRVMNAGARDANPIDVDLIRVLSFNVAMLEAMQEEGLDLSACIRVLSAAEKKADPTAAERKRRQRAKEQTERDMSQRDVTRDKGSNERDNLTSKEGLPQEDKSSSPQPWALPVGVSLQVWTDLKSNRKRKRLPNTPTAWKKFQADLAETSAQTGIPPPQLIENAQPRAGEQFTIRGTNAMNALTEIQPQSPSNASSGAMSALMLELAKSLKLVAPISMSADAQLVWLQAAVDALDGIHAHEVAAVSAELRRSVTRPSQIVPRSQGSSMRSASVHTEPTRRAVPTPLKWRSTAKARNADEGSRRQAQDGGCLRMGTPSAARRRAARRAQTFSAEPKRARQHAPAHSPHGIEQWSARISRRDAVRGQAMTSRFQLALWAAILAWGLAYDCGVPPWRAWVPGGLLRHRRLHVCARLVRLAPIEARSAETTGLARRARAGLAPNNNDIGEGPNT